MEPEVILQITPDVYVAFNTVEEIDDLIDVLEDCRNDLEHQIDVDKEHRRNKYRKNKKRNNGKSSPKNPLVNEFHATLEEYEASKNKLRDECPLLYNALKPLFDNIDGKSKHIKAYCE